MSGADLPDVREGDIWQDQDPRQPRFVRVVSVVLHSEKPYAYIQAVEHSKSEGWHPVRNLATARNSPIRAAQLTRFRAQRTGYALHDRSPAGCICPRREGDDSIIYKHRACPTHGDLVKR